MGVLKFGSYVRGLNIKHLLRQIFDLCPKSENIDFENVHPAKNIKNQEFKISKFDISTSIKSLNQKSDEQKSCIDP